MREPKLVLLVGAPRSGTTWLQSMLGAHPAAATPQETDLFSRYVTPLAEAWSWQLRGGPDAWRKRRFKGLPGVLTEAQFDDMVQGVIDTALDGIAKLAPDASVIVEKSPAHSFCANLLAKYAPEARVVHLVRDGRDVAASLMAAGESWGQGWAPRDLKRAARSWVQHVESATNYRRVGFVYREVRYESLVARDGAVLREIHDFCGLPLGDGEVAERYERFGLDAMAAGGDDPILVGGEFASAAADRTEPAGFFGAGQSGGWRESWSTADRLLFRTVAGQTLERLGYEPDGRWAGTPAESVRYGASVLARRGAAAAFRRVGKLAQRAADRTGRDLP
jgi:hypothetical protein